jgi:anti-sigma regulatory factor (Ser/Thr protein kinase)
MNAMAPTRQIEINGRRVRLATGPAAAAEARSHVRTAIRAWDVPVDSSVAVLLTSELVTNAITHEGGDHVTLGISCSYGQLRVEVHDTSCFMPVLVDAPADAETGRGLMLVDTLSAGWGSYRTPAGKAVYFTLAFQADQAEDGEPAPEGEDAGTVSCEPAHGSPAPLTAPAIRVARRGGSGGRQPRPAESLRRNGAQR